MASSRPLIPSNWLTVGLAGRWHTTVAIQEPTETVNEHGDVSTSFATVTGCSAVEAIVRHEGTVEVEKDGVMVQVSTYNVILKGYYPAVTDKHQVVYQSRNHGVVAYDSPPGSPFTHLVMREVV